MKKKVWIIIASVLFATILALTSVIVVDIAMTKNSYNPYKRIVKENTAYGEQEFVAYGNRYQTGLEKVISVCAPMDKIVYTTATEKKPLSFGEWSYLTVWQKGGQSIYSYDAVVMRNDEIIRDNVTDDGEMLSFLRRNAIAEEPPKYSTGKEYKAVFYLDAPYTSNAHTVFKEVEEFYSLGGVKVEWVGMQTSDDDGDIIMGVPVKLYGQKYTIKDTLNWLNSDTETLKVIEAMGFLGEAKLDIKNRIDYLDKRENHTALAICVTATYDGIMALNEITENGKRLTLMKIGGVL